MRNHDFKTYYYNTKKGTTCLLRTKEAPIQSTFSYPLSKVCPTSLPIDVKSRVNVNTNTIHLVLHIVRVCLVRPTIVRKVKQQTLINRTKGKHRVFYGQPHYKTRTGIFCGVGAACRERERCVAVTSRNTG